MSRVPDLPGLDRTLDRSRFLDILTHVGKTAKKPAGHRRVAPDQIARLCHALSDETRLAILDRLRNGEQCVCNLMDLLGAGQSRLSFHLKTLKDAGLVRDRRYGRWIHYSLDTGTLDLVEEFISSFRCARDGAEASSCCQK
jgi:ArsR family transcriptional regulator, arsenate/arsenite/antimonite-responsive transcriptional repressor